MSVPLPLPNTYWVLPGQLLAGEHPFGENPAEALDRLALLSNAGLDYFIDLTEAGEQREYRRLLSRKAEYRRYPIADTCVPKDPGQMRALQADLRTALMQGHGVYLHCRAGIGRTGVAIGCFLVEEGLAGKAALKQLNRLWKQSARAATWPKVPQTPEQADYVVHWPERRQSVALP